ncbi:MAG: DUF881 domain-containing protein [bacterium]|nr:DUF881 domain-containing protein [bacterium]
MKRSQLSFDYHALHLRPARTVLLLVSIAGGILVSSQWRTRIVRVINPVQPYTSLTETRDALTQEQQQLKDQLETINAGIEKRTSDLKLTNRLDQGIVEQSDAALELAGLTDVQGKGITVTLDDSPDGLIKDQAIAHAADLRDMVSVLRGVGAEAISINGERIVSTTAIDCIVNTILVNETRLSNPFVVQAIGNPEQLEKVLNDPRILQDLHDRVINEGVKLKVEQNGLISISAYKGVLPGVYSKVAL